MVVPLHVYINSGLPVIIMLLFLAGCATTPAPAPDSQQPQETAAAGGMPQKKVTPEVQQAFDKAVATLRSGAYKLAIREFNSVSRQAPNLAAPYINQAIAYRQMGDSRWILGHRRKPEASGAQRAAGRDRCRCGAP